MRISDWSSDVCSSDLLASITAHGPIAARPSDAADCTLIAIWKLATVSPPTARAAPPVGSTWLVPLQSSPSASAVQSPRNNEPAACPRSGQQHGARGPRARCSDIESEREREKV